MCISWPQPHSRAAECAISSSSMFVSWQMMHIAASSLSFSSLRAAAAASANAFGTGAGCWNTCRLKVWFRARPFGWSREDVQALGGAETAGGTRTACVGAGAGGGAGAGAGAGGVHARYPRPLAEKKAPVPSRAAPLGGASPAKARSSASLPLSSAKGVEVPGSSWSALSASFGVEASHSANGTAHVSLCRSGKRAAQETHPGFGVRRQRSQTAWLRITYVRKTRRGTLSGTCGV
mmetsp:Transcript_7565/g.31454  ORF Transcript_7565/g.31454 Transcript_7565/m.31454 type:complete len:235 (+) Transcript_7565:259-963(+)